jgi:CMP-N,N'-diacetyllegionaminic acid synthase
MKPPVIYAIITARGGSKGVPRKNIRMVAGKPLIAYTIEAALGCSLVSGCFVTTEDKEIKEVSQSFGASVIDRPAELATDTARSSDAVAHALEAFQGKGGLPDYFVLLQPTSPLRNAQHLQLFLEGFLASGRRCGLSITEAEHHPWKTLIDGPGGIGPVRDVASMESPRQTLPKAWRINGAIYAMEVALFLRTRNFFANPVFTFAMSNQDSLDIDSELDLDLLERILADRFGIKVQQSL